MLKTKSFLAMLLLVAMLVLGLTSCQIGNTTTTSGEAEKTTIRVGGLKGPTSIGMAKLMADDKTESTLNDYEFTIAAAADELTPLLLQGKLDMVAVPANLAAVLYKRTEGQVQVLAVNTLGVQYIVQKGGETIDSIADLRGKTVYATGKGTVNEYVLSHLLTQNGLSAEDVTVEWKSEPTEVVATLKTASEGVAMLPQPYVTIAQTQIPELTVAFGFEDEWNALATDSRLITGVMVVRSAFAEEHPEAIAKFLTEYKASAEYVKANPAEAAVWVTEFLGIPTPVATQAIPHCNIAYIDGEDMKTALSAYLEVLFGINPASVGGQLPSDDFYYSAK